MVTLCEPVACSLKYLNSRSSKYWHTLTILHQTIHVKCRHFTKEKRKNKQEAHGPRVTHLSDIATTDMQMLCNIFPTLSSQLMKRSSFEQFLILKKNIYGMPVNGAWSFEQTLNGRQLGFTIGTILAIFDLRVTPMLPIKFQVNWPFGSGEEANNFSRRLPWWPSWISDWHDFSYFWSTSHPNVSYQVWSQLAFRWRRRS